jgi:hypothetical protein
LSAVAGVDSRLAVDQQHVTLLATGDLMIDEPCEALDFGSTWLA